MELSIGLITPHAKQKARLPVADTEDALAAHPQRYMARNRDKDNLKGELM